MIVSIMRQFLCLFGWHSWSMARWNSYNPMKRQCGHCGRAERQLTARGGGWINDRAKSLFHKEEVRCGYRSSKKKRLFW